MSLIQLVIVNNYLQCGWSGSEFCGVAIRERKDEDKERFGRS
jgi:hypothetical protein